MKIVKEISYLAPEGELTGTIISGKLNVEEKNGKRRESVRLTIAVDPIPNHHMFDYRVRMDYWESQANDLITDAKMIIGSEANELTNSDGEIRDGKLYLLVNKRVKFTVIHDSKPGHKDAYRKVVNLRPLNEDNRQAA
ncbi:MAG: hypothetical protein WCL71_05940 [Deltaproteobacteria bacterium]